MNSSKPELGWRTGAMRSLLIVALAVVSTACQQVEAEHAQEPATVAADPFADASRAEPATVMVTVTGDLEFSWEDEVAIQIVTFTPEARESHLLSVGVGLMLPVREDEAERFRWAFDVVGGYDGGGTYNIPPSEGFEGDVGALSNAFLTYVELVDPSAEDPYSPQNVEAQRVFNKAVEGCVVEIGDHEATGSLTCPDLAAEDGSRITLDATWRVNGT